MPTQMPVPIADVGFALACASPMPTQMPVPIADVGFALACASSDDDPWSADKKGPGGKHDKMRTFTPEEAELVMKLVATHSPRWTHIAKEMSRETGYERTAASVRNYYKRFQTSKSIAQRDAGIKKLNKCQMCGQIKRGHICTAAMKNYVTETGPNPTPEQMLALSGRGELLLPLAPASLCEVETPGASPISTISAGPISVGPFSPSDFAVPLSSPVVVCDAPTAAPPPAPDARTSYFEMAEVVPDALECLTEAAATREVVVEAQAA